MVSRKRTRSDADAAPEQPSEEPGLLDQLRNCWEFANVMQYIAMFGKPMKIDEDFGIEVWNNLSLTIYQNIFLPWIFLRFAFCAQCADSPISATGSRNGMSQTRSFGETYGDRTLSSQMDFVASGSLVRDYRAQVLFI